MPDATITSTASTFGTITGTFAADQSTITGTVTGVVVGTLDGSVGVPGIGVPDGGTTGQVLKKASNTSYDTVWGTDLASAAWGTITGTLSSQTDLQTALDAKAPLASPAFTGNPTAPTAALGDNDTSLATTAFVQQELASGTAIAKNLEVDVRNQSGSTIPAGAIVYISGATGNKPLITLAQANNDANSAQTLGFVKTAIANNATGHVIVRGECDNLDTSALTEGAQLYLSPTTAGTWTTTKPSAPNHLVYVGIVVRSHPTQGVILVAIQNGYELEELHNVLIDTPSNGQVLKYDAAQGLWINGTDSSGVAWGGITGTLSSQTDLNTALGLKYDASNPSGYITSSALTGYALESWVSSQGYLMDAPSDGNQYARKDGAWDVVTPATNYITSVQYPLAVSSGDLTIDLSDYATQAWVYSLNYITSSALSPYLTSATAASTYQTISGMSSYAPLASPALTGTPTAPTATAGTNTTQIATTAFVNAAVPAFAATADINAPSSTTKVMSPSNVVDMILSANFQMLYYGAGVSGASGTGGGFGNNGGRWHDFASPNAGISGYGAWCFDTNSNSVGLVATDRGASTISKNWSKKIWIAGRCTIGNYPNTTLDGDTNTFFRISLGGKTSFSAGDISAANRGIGFKVPGGGASAMVLQVSNGTTVTSVTSSFTPSLRTVFDWKIYSDGTGNVTLYINDSPVATTSAGPTGQQNYGLYFEMTDSNGSNTKGLLCSSYGTKIYYSV